jgi:hypothetical protein
VSFIKKLSFPTFFKYKENRLTYGGFLYQCNIDYLTESLRALAGLNFGTFIAGTDRERQLCTSRIHA